MTHVIVLHNRTVTLQPEQMIQAGGEGIVFDLGKTAVKLYHQPDAQRQAKLRVWLQQAPQLPAGLLAPTAPVRDLSGALIGFEMAKLPAGSLPMKKLSSPLFWQQQRPSLPAVIQLLLTIHHTLTNLHRLGIVVGDLNDTNLFFTDEPQPRPFWVDVDSMQIGRFPCPAALESFLDPQLYYITDFSRRPSFTPASDWYAFAVLVVKTLLQAHPYGGVHHQHKTMRARAAARISLFCPDVQPPQRARPIAALTDGLQDALQATFAHDQRQPLNLAHLVDYAQSLATCAQCGLAYPQQRAACPVCQQRTPPPPQQGPVRTLLSVDGVIVQVALRGNGRFWCIVQDGHAYRLIRLGLGGKLDERPLFEGQPGYRFGVFDRYLVVNPPRGTGLLILDLSQPTPQQAALVDTERFRETAVFAATPAALYRLAGGWMMRGVVQHGHYVEDAVMTAHRAQTQLWASPYADVIGGYHRVFAEYRPFLRRADGVVQDLALWRPPVGGSIGETAVAFSPHDAAFIQQLHHPGQRSAQLHRLTAGAAFPAPYPTQANFSTLCAHYPFIDGRKPTETAVSLTAEDRLLALPNGILVWQPNRLLLM